MKKAMDNKEQVDKQSIEIVTHINNGEVIRVDKSILLHPVIKFNNGTIKWFEDNIKN